MFHDFDRRARPGREPKNRALAKFQTLSDTVQLSSDTITTTVATPPYQYARQSYRSVVIADSPLAYYRLGEMQPAVTAGDESTGFFGTYVGTPLTGATGPGNSEHDWATRFQSAVGADYVTIAHSSILNSTAAITVECWANPDLLNAPAAGNSLFGKWAASSSGRNWLLWFNSTTGQPSWFISSGQINSPTSATTGAWYHLVGVSDGTTMRLYVNGATAVTATAPNLNGASTYTVNIGKLRADDGAFPARSAIDECAIYATALSSSRVLAHYNAMITPTATGNALIVGGGQFR